MAILENRSRITNQGYEFISVTLSTLKKCFAFFLLLLSIQLLYFTPCKRISNITLELFGNIVSITIPIYDTVLEKINLLTQTVGRFKNLEMENIRLRLEIAKLQKLQNMNYSIHIENSQLKTLLPVIQDHKFNFIIARLLSVSITPFSNTALIGAGNNNGVEVGQIVTSNDGLMGKIVEVSDNYSKVMLINDFNSHIPIITLKSRERGILVGCGDKLNVLYLNDNHSVEEGESLVTSGDGMMYPYGVEVAKVTKVSKDSVIAQSVINLSKVEFVIVQFIQ